MNLDIKFPEKMQFLFEPYRYKIVKGGRGSGKSWSMAAALLIKGLQKTERILCAREFQNSIDESVYQLLTATINKYNLHPYYEVQAKKIFSKINGTTFSFVGLRRNIFSMKSFEGTTICWVEEAQTVTRQSWEILIPTIRESDSEIWVSFNPDMQTDETYRRFVLNTPPRCKLVEMNYQDNPWFPDVLREEMEQLKLSDYDSYLNVWGGQCRQSVQGAVYANELRKALENKQITKVPYEPNYTVDTFWDLGYSDYTAIWFAQMIGFEIRVIDYYQMRLEDLEHYIKLLDKKNYRYGKAYLPHDGANKTIQGAGLSIKAQLEKAGYRAVTHQRESKVVQINSVRTIFPKCVFDEENCVDGLNALRHYKYKVNETGQFSKEPDHDESSHGADAFSQLAIHLKPIKDLTKLPRQAQTDYNIFG